MAGTLPALHNTRRSHQSQCTITITITMDAPAPAPAPAPAADVELDFGIMSSDEEQQTQPDSKRRKSANSDLYNLFTTEGVPVDLNSKQGTALVCCKACIEHNKMITKENEN
jgi:hypothetical protein